MWSEHLMPLAEAGFRAVAVALPGFGDAPLARDEDAPWKDVLQTMDELSMDRAALVGNSFGGEVALRVALVRPTVAVVGARDKRDFLEGAEASPGRCPAVATR